MQLFKMESSDRSDKPLPRLVEISRSIIIIYVILSLACVVAYLFVGLTPFDALTHGMTTVATGGFSTHDESLGYYESSSVLWVAILFMIVGGLPFSVFVAIFFTRNIPKLDPQVLTFILIILFSCILLILYQNGEQTKSIHLNTEYIFNVVSIVTTTGYSSGDFMNYGSLGPVMFFFLIIMAGYRIGPFEVESALSTHNAVAECAVIATPDKVRGEVIEAFVVLMPGTEKSDQLTEDLQQWVKTNFAAHAFPRHITYVEELPKTPSGKIQRFVLREQRKNEILRENNNG